MLYWPVQLLPRICGICKEDNNTNNCVCNEGRFSCVWLQSDISAGHCQCLYTCPFDLVQVFAVLAISKKCCDLQITIVPHKNRTQSAGSLIFTWQAFMFPLPCVYFLCTAYRVETVNDKGLMIEFTGMINTSTQLSISIGYSFR